MIQARKVKGVNQALLVRKFKYQKKKEKRKKANKEHKKIDHTKRTTQQ